MIKQNTTPLEDARLISFEPISLLQLQTTVAEIIADMCQYRPEFSRLIWLQRNAGTRVNELFQPERWSVVSNGQVHLQPQKGNALRVLNFADIGFTDAAAFQSVLNDMSRLSKRQYERAFASIVQSFNLWRLYDNGFLHPSTHLLRHLKIKELAAAGNEKTFIATWIGEKNIDNLDYYLNSRYYL